MINQKGIAPLLILMALGVAVVAGAIAYGIFVAQKQSPSITEIQKMDALKEQTAQVGTPECPELDYTGCDTSQAFMTWTDDGVR